MLEKEFKDDPDKLVRFLIIFSLFLFFCNTTPSSLVIIISLHRWAQCASSTLQLGISPTAAPSVFRSDVSHVGRTDIPARKFQQVCLSYLPNPPWQMNEEATLKPTTEFFSMILYNSDPNSKVYLRRYLLETPCNLIKSFSLIKLFQGSWTRNWSPKSAPATTLRASTTLTYSLSRCHSESRQIYFHNQHFELV